ncbi:paraquat-inducible protein A [Echinimonas agarilytica]|uniref:Paraquat-inducible protein A n=1 Tax=Echinimonas agarilytica TaxID=1215918 RepID=A0AA42B862_9GAMM|nr:paraquat-inducible protein A [Echinimonas agarilytica]MCM2679976.1 paraquat-inducible protein A [Echinimonas agarilytica]
MAKPHMVACTDCDLLVSLLEVPPHNDANCPRCGKRIFSHSPFKLDGLFALAFTGFILWFPSNFLPLITIRLFNQELSTTIWGAGLTLIDGGFWFVGSLVIFAGAVAPLVTMGCLIALLYGYKRQWAPSTLVVLMKIMNRIRKWAMLEIYLISFLVAVFKLKDYADIYFGLGLVSYVFMFAVLIALAQQFNRHYMWHLIEQRQSHG